MAPTYAAFPEAEHRGHLARAQAMLRRNDIACCVSVAPEHLYYLRRLRLLGQRQQPAGAHLHGRRRRADADRA